MNGPRSRTRRWLLATAATVLIAAPSVRAVPVLQLYVEGATYNYEHESWVVSSGTSSARLWIIGKVAGPGGKGTIENVRLSVA